MVELKVVIRSRRKFDIFYPIKFILMCKYVPFDVKISLNGSGFLIIPVYFFSKIFEMVVAMLDG